MSFLVDTDICSAHLRQKGAINNRFLQYTGRLHISAITLGELYAWALRANAPPQRAQGLRDMLSDLRVLEVTADVALRFGQLQARLLDNGTPAPGMDLMNAATALVYDLTLVTHNLEDYANIPGLRLLDWLET
jgi:predicted nucleic acid-binding protein